MAGIIATGIYIPYFRLPRDTIARAWGRGSQGGERAVANHQAGIINPREQLDIAEVHDCFTCTELCIYEDFGFSARGKGPEDLLAGFFDLDGALPVNADGGLKCFGHPVGASGLRMTYEIYKQMQGRAQSPKRQLKDVRLGLAQHLWGAAAGMRSGHFRPRARLSEIAVRTRSESTSCFLSGVGGSAHVTEEIFRRAFALANASHV